MTGNTFIKTIVKVIIILIVAGIVCTQWNFK